MKQKLLQATPKALLLFPRNIRSITEYTFSHSQEKNVKVLLVSSFSVFLLTLIFLQGVTLWYNHQQREVYAQQRVYLEEEVVYWQQVSDKYQGYRDVYYRIAALEYKLGNTLASQEYIKKALKIDPNFSEGRVLGTKVGL